MAADWRPPQLANETIEEYHVRLQSIPKKLEASQWATVLDWLKAEGYYVAGKFDMGLEDERHVMEGAGEDSWLWQRCIENYVGRVRMFGLEDPRGQQALMKTIGALVGMASAMVRVYGLPPEPGHESGEIVKWTPTPAS